MSTDTIDATTLAAPAAPAPATAAPAAAATKPDFPKTNTSLYVGDLNVDVSEPVLFEVRGAWAARRAI